MDILLEMTGEDLLSIGITQFGVRHRIIKKIKEVVQGPNNGEWEVGRKRGRKVGREREEGREGGR